MTREALVLCGGRSTRMGRDKAGLAFGEENLLTRTVRRLRPLVEDVVIATRADHEVALTDVRVVHDAVTDQGPLQGLLAGLEGSTADGVFATACDAPLLRPALVELLFDALGTHDVAVAVAQGYTHPLCAVYRPRVREVIASLLANGQRRPVALYDAVPTQRVSEEALRRVDPDLESLTNCNDPATYETTLRQWRTWPRVRVELFEMARRMAGVATCDVVARTIREALEELGSHLPALEGTVVRRGTPCGPWRVSRDGKQFEDDLDQPVAEGTALVIVSALAGG